MTSLDSRNLERRPRAVALGGAYGNEAFERIRSACESGDNRPATVAWFRADTSKALDGPKDAYAEIVAARLKRALDSAELSKDGHKAQLVWY